MAPDYKTYLAANVLNDGQIVGHCSCMQTLEDVTDVIQLKVSYRLLSRELKVHSNVAKKMLYDFHHAQSTKKAGSVYATYLLDGEPGNPLGSDANGHQQDGEDMHMQSSPFMSSSMPQETNEEDAVPLRKVMLAREEDLEAAKASFLRTYSIHVYSLGPSSIQNLQILSECNRAISAKHIGEDPLVAGKQYGTIQNGGVKRRTAKRPLIQAPSAPKITSQERSNTKPQEPLKSAQGLKPTDRPSSSGKSSTPTSQVETKPPDKKPTNKTAPPKREKSDIFKSFAKPKTTLKRGDTGSSADASPAPSNVQSKAYVHQADEPMKDASEHEDEDIFTGTNKSTSKPGKSRSDRENQLRKMMDEGDEEMQDTTEQRGNRSQGSSVDTPISQKAVSPEVSVVTTGARRRGRQKIMRKKTIKDEEGYLVTQEEPAWESFSEEEPAPQKEKLPVSTMSSTTGKIMKPNGKPGQGNIMSFFGKSSSN